MYKALEVEFINEFTKAETHKISLKNQPYMENYTFQSQNLRKKNFMWHRINQNVDDFLEYLQNLRAIM